MMQENTKKMDIFLGLNTVKQTEDFRFKSTNHGWDSMTHLFGMTFQGNLHTPGKAVQDLALQTKTVFHLTIAFQPKLIPVKFSNVI